MLIAVLAAIVYAPIRRHGFVTFDDGAYVVDNPHVSTGVTAANVRWAFANPYLATGGPLTWISHMLDVQLFGLNAGPQHVTSLLLHVLNAVLLLCVLYEMTGAVWRSAFVAMLFAIHPAHVESVAWIAERKDVLSTFWWMTTTGAYVAYVRRPGMWRYLAVAGAFVAGLLAKPMLVTLPAVLLLLDVWPLARIVPGRDGWPQARRMIVEKLPLLAPALAVIVWTYVEQRGLGAIAAPSVTLRLENAAVSIVKYVAMLVCPTSLAVFYPYPTSISPALAVTCVLAITSATVAAIGAVRRLAFVTVGWLWFLITLVPVIGLVQVGGHAMADRFTYVPSIGLFIAASWGGAAAASRFRLPRVVPVGAAAAAVAVLAVMTAQQVSYWQDSVSLWTHALEVTQDNDRAHANLGVTLAIEGDRDAAIAHYRESLRINPSQAKTQNNLALLLTDPSQRDEAERRYREAIRLDPGYANAHNNLAVLLGDAHRFDESMAESREAIRLDPANAAAHMALAVTFHDVGRPADSLAEIRAALALRPAEAPWHLMAGDMLMELHQRDQAIEEAQLAARLDPSLTAAAQAAAQWQVSK